MPSGIFDGLLTPNATVDIYGLTTAKDASGGNVETPALVASGVPVLISQTSGSRDGRFDNTNNVLSGTMSGESAYLARTNTKIYIASGFGITGIWVHPESVTTHGPADNWIDVWYTIKWTQLQAG